MHSTSFLASSSLTCSHTHAPQQWDFLFALSICISLSLLFSSRSYSPLLSSLLPSSSLTLLLPDHPPFFLFSFPLFSFISLPLHYLLIFCSLPPASFFSRFPIPYIPPIHVPMTPSSLYKFYIFFSLLSPSIIPLMSFPILNLATFVHLLSL